MLKYTLKRLALGITTLFGVVSIVFFLFNIMPGDSARLMLGQRADKESLKIIQKDLGLDKSLTTQYFIYINDLSPISFHSKNPKNTFYLNKNKYDYKQLINLGSAIVVIKIPYLRRSYQTKKKVSGILGKHILETVVLATSSIFIATFIGVLIGIIAAIKKESFIDRFLLSFSAIGMSMPSFYSAILISWIFGYLLSNYTGLTMTGSLFEYNDLGTAKIIRWDNLILPCITLGIRPISVIMQLSRNSMLEVLSKDFIRTAKAKGLRFSIVVLKHALKNSLNPVITAVSGMFASLLAGALFIETIFAWKGIGWVLYEALTKYDFPLIMGGVILTSSIFVVVNITVDLTYKLLDNRVTLK